MSGFESWVGKLQRLEEPDQVAAEVETGSQPGTSSGQNPTEVAVKRVGLTFALIGIAVLTVFTPQGSAADWLICVVLGVLAVLTGLGGWFKGALGEWWAGVDPSPHPPGLPPRFWPGGRADVAQKAVKERKDRDAA